MNPISAFKVDAEMTFRGDRYLCFEMIWQIIPRLREGMEIVLKILFLLEGQKNHC